MLVTQQPPSMKMRVVDEGSVTNGDGHVGFPLDGTT